MIIEISAVFKVEGEEVMFAKPSISYVTNERQITSQEQYDKLKEMVQKNIPDGYTVKNATKEEVQEYNEEN